MDGSLATPTDESVKLCLMAENLRYNLYELQCFRCWYWNKKYGYRQQNVRQRQKSRGLKMCSKNVK